MAPITETAGIPVSDPTPVVSYAPVVLHVPGRAVDLEVKVSAPATGSDLPVILLSHGHGGSSFLSSLRGYGPLADFWAARGFVVVQPTHQDSKALGLDPDGPEGPLFWRSRATDMSRVIDHLDEVEATVPGLAGRVDRTRIAAVGHSLGGLTVGLLCGQQVTDPLDGSIPDLRDERITVGVLMAPPGLGERMDGVLAATYQVLATSTFEQMTTPALVVAGDRDVAPPFSSHVDWRSDAYRASPGPKSLLTLLGAEHMLGGVSGYDAGETSDENPERVAALRSMVWAFLRTALHPGETAWADARAALEASADPLGRVESR